MNSLDQRKEFEHRLERRKCIVEYQMATDDFSEETLLYLEKLSTPRLVCMMVEHLCKELWFLKIVLENFYKVV